jgi:hypothetical protein
MRKTCVEPMDNYLENVGIFRRLISHLQAMWGLPRFVHFLYPAFPFILHSFLRHFISVKNKFSSFSTGLIKTTTNREALFNNTRSCV